MLRAIDSSKNKAYCKAIQNIIDHNDRVLVYGDETGILSMWAAKQGAKVVSHDINYNNVKINGLDDYIKPLENDYGKPNFCIVDLLDTMLISDQQVKTINSLHDAGVLEDVKMIPEGVTNFFEPVSFDFEFCDFHMPMLIQSPDVQERCFESLSPAVQYSKIDFDKKIDPKCSYNGKSFIRKNGWLNALKFTTVVHLSRTIMISNTNSFCVPVYVPIQESFVRCGDVVDFHIDYIMGEGYNNLKINVE